MTPPTVDTPYAHFFFAFCFSIYYLDVTQMKHLEGWVEQKPTPQPRVRHVFLTKKALAQGMYAPGRRGSAPA